MSRKLDAAIAEALGYALKIYQEIECIHWREDDGTPQLAGLPHYSTDGDAMLDLDEEMRARGCSLYVLRDIKGYVVMYWSREKDGYLCGRGEADTMPLAVALAAYKALTGKEWVE